MTRILGTPLRDYLAPLGLWVIAALYLAAAADYPPESRAFPAMVAWAMLVFVTLDLASRTRTQVGTALTRWLNPASGLGQPRTHTVYPVAKQVAAILWVAGFTAALVALGVLTAIPLFVFASMRWRGGRRYWVCVLTAAGATLFIWLLFSVLLRLQLYPGLFASSF
jgi:hypothetical protein